MSRWPLCFDAAFNDSHDTHSPQALARGSTSLRLLRVVLQEESRQELDRVGRPAANESSYIGESEQNRTLGMKAWASVLGHDVGMLSVLAMRDAPLLDQSRKPLEQDRDDCRVEIGADGRCLKVHLVLHAHRGLLRRFCLSG